MGEKTKIIASLHRLRHAFEKNRVSRIADRLALQLSSLSDPDLALYSFGQKLREMPCREGALILGQICQKREEGNVLFERTHLHLLAKDSLLEVLGETKTNNIIQELRFLGYEEALRYLTEDPPNLQFERNQEGTRRPGESLGRRISLARKTTSRIIERLIQDSDEKVIRTILGNPRLTEAEVLKIASSYRTPPSILATMSHDQRWICRYKVKLSLVYNPNTPLRVSLGLLPLLMRQDLLEIAQYETLPRAVREKAGRMARKRAPEEILPLRDKP